MQYRRLGKTELMVSEVGFGGEWLERHNYEECKAMIDRAEELGINILDCWMSEPNVRSKIGKALEGRRERWFIQGHIGSTWQNGQYERSRDLEKCREAFEDLLARLQTDYVDLGMIHFVDQEADWENAMNGPYMAYVKELKACGKIHHIGMSTHNPLMAKRAAQSGLIEMILFSINPAFDLLPPTDNIDDYFAEEYEDGFGGIDPARAEVYKLCEQNDVGITVMKPYAGGRLFDEARSPFGVALTPVQCIHYCLTRRLHLFWQGMTRRSMWNRRLLMKTPEKRKRIMRQFWRRRPGTPLGEENVRIADTASPVRKKLTSRW